MNAIEKLELMADIFTDGHYSIFKFTTNYRVCLGTPSDRFEIGSLRCEGKTLDEAVEKLYLLAVENRNKNIDWYSFIRADSEQYKKNFYGFNK